MDPTAVWTAVGVACAAAVGVAGILVAFLAADNLQKRRRVAELEHQLTDYLLRLTESDRALRQAEHDKRDAEQVVRNLKATQEMLKRRRGEGHRRSDETEDPKD